MEVRLLTGTFFSVDGFALNDMEALSVGDVDDLTLGVLANGGCDWGDTVFFNRG